MKLFNNWGIVLFVMLQLARPVELKITSSIAIGNLPFDQHEVFVKYLVPVVQFQMFVPGVEEEIVIVLVSIEFSFPVVSFADAEYV